MKTKNTKVEHVRQRNELDCGFCVAAMMTGVDYDSAAEWDPNPAATDGMSVNELIEMVFDIEEEQYEAQKKKGKPARLIARSNFQDVAGMCLESWCAVDWNKDAGCIIFLIRPNGDPTLQHYVLYDSRTEMLHDPQHEAAQPIGEYCQSHWQVMLALHRRGAL